MRGHASFSGSAAVAAGQSNPPTPGGSSGGVRRRGVLEGTRFVGIYLVDNRLMVIEGRGLGAERGPRSHRRVFTFRGYMQSKSMSGVLGRSREMQSAAAYAVEVNLLRLGRLPGRLRGVQSVWPGRHGSHPGAKKQKGMIKMACGHVRRPLERSHAQGTGRKAAQRQLPLESGGRDRPENRVTPFRTPKTDEV